VISIYSLILAGTLIIGYTDIRWRTIPNAILIPLGVVVLLYKLMLGFEPFLWALFYALFWFGIGLIFYLIGGMGGGDVKFMAVIGAWLGIQNTYMILILASLLGFIWGLFIYTGLGILKSRIKTFGTGLYLKITSTRGDVGWERLPDDINAPAPKTAIPLGTCLAVAVIAQQLYMIF